MSAPDFQLDDLERDALTELVNIGVGRAAASLRKMLQTQIILSVPSVEIISRRAAALLIGQRENQTLVAVHQSFEGTFSGRAMLILPESSGASLVRAIVGDEMGDADLESLQEEALAETGNVILNNCVGSMANMLEQTLKISLPGIRRGGSGELLAPSDSLVQEDLILFLYINFSVKDRCVQGYLAMIMDLLSLERLRQLIREFVARVT